jgi:hypothetical protein
MRIGTAASPDLTRSGFAEVGSNRYKRASNTSCAALPGLALIDVKSTEASTIHTTQLFSVVAIGKADMAATTRLVVVD